MHKTLRQDILNLLKKEKGAVSFDSICTTLILKYKVPKKKQKYFKINLKAKNILPLITARHIEQIGKNIYMLTSSRPRNNFVSEYGEKLSIKTLNALKLLTKNQKIKAGFYFLYSKNKPYYVGISNNIVIRLLQHLKDKHKGRWDSYNLYFTEHINHAQNIETIILRNVKLQGNNKGGGLSKANYISKKLEKLQSLLS